MKKHIGVSFNFSAFICFRMHLELFSLINYRYSLHLCLVCVQFIRFSIYSERKKQWPQGVRALPKFGNVHLLSGTTAPPFLSESSSIPPLV